MRRVAKVDDKFEVSEYSQKNEHVYLERPICLLITRDDI